MLSDFIGRKLRSAQYKILKDRSYFGEIAGLNGVWANAKDLETCRNELREVLEEWVLLKLRSGERISGLESKSIRCCELAKNA